MTRIQILELPEGASDDRPPFVLVIDQARIEDFYPTVEGKSTWQAFQERLATEDPLKDMAEQISARAVLVFEETIDIPGNDVPVDPDGYPIKVRVEGEFEKFREQVEQELLAAQGKITRAVRGDAIQRVRQLHSPTQHRRQTVCIECSALDNTGSTDNTPTPHPCNTIRELDGSHTQPNRNITTENAADIVASHDPSRRA